VNVRSGPRGGTVCSASGFRGEPHCHSCATTGNSVNSGQDKNCTWDTTGWPAGDYVLEVYTGGHANQGYCNDGGVSASVSVKLLAAPTPTPTLRLCSEIAAGYDYYLCSNLTTTDSGCSNNICYFDIHVTSSRDCSGLTPYCRYYNRIPCGSNVCVQPSSGNCFCATPTPTPKPTRPPGGCGQQCGTGDTCTAGLVCAHSPSYGTMCGKACPDGSFDMTPPCDCAGPTATPTRTPTPTPTRIPTPTPSICQRNDLDIVQILDASGSIIFPHDYSLEVKNFAKQIVNSFNIGAQGNNSKMGIVKFSNDASVVIGLSSQPNDIKRAIDGITFGGSTCISCGLNKAKTLFDSGSNSSKLAILFSDGLSNVEQDPNKAVIDAARVLQNKGACLYVLGLSDLVDESLLREISDNYFRVANFEQLVTKVEEIMRRVCDQKLICGTCPNGENGNLNCDSRGLINETDLSLLLASWSPQGPVPSPRPGHHSADIVRDGLVNAEDLGWLLRHWRVK